MSKTQTATSPPREGKPAGTLLQPPASSHVLITVTVSSWAHPILSSNLSRKFKTLLQDSSSWTPRHHHSTPLLKKLHWLPISERIKYKVACMCFHAINGSGPTYLSELFFGFPHAQNPTIQTQDSRLSHFHLLWTLCLEFTPTRHQAMLNSSIF